MSQGDNDSLNEVVRQLAAIAQQLAEKGLSIDAQLLLARQVFKTCEELYGTAAYLYALEQKKKELMKKKDTGNKRKDFGGNSDHQGNGGDLRSLSLVMEIFKEIKGTLKRLPIMEILSRGKLPVRVKECITVRSALTIIKEGIVMGIWLPVAYAIS